MLFFGFGGGRRACLTQTVLGQRSLFPISAYLWQLMRCNMLQLLKNLRFHSNGKEITDADILEWSNSKVRNSGSKSRMASFKV